MSEPAYEDLVGPEVVADEDLEADVKLRAHDLFLRLQQTFTPPAYVTLEEVRDATGFDGQRTADAIAISLYRSRGKAIWGFEFKVSRNDWLKELKQPEKAESILRYCHHWALVVPNKDIVKPGELPSSWGMYVAQKTRLKCVVPSPKLDPIPMSMTMLTALIYAMSIRQSKIDTATLSAEYNRGHTDGKEGANRGRNDFERYYKELAEKVEAFDKASGLQIRYGWHKPDKVGAVVNLLLGGSAGLQQVLNTAKHNLRNTESLKEAIEKQIGILEHAIAGSPQVDEEED